MRTSYSLTTARLVLTGLFALAVTAIPFQAAVAQTADSQKPSTEVQQLKERVTQLEQTVDELKTLLKTAVESQKKPDAATGEKVAATADKVDYGLPRSHLDVVGKHKASCPGEEVVNLGR